MKYKNILKEYQKEGNHHFSVSTVHRTAYLVHGIVISEPKILGGNKALHHIP